MSDSTQQLVLVFLAALGTALATGLGAIPLLWMRDARPSTLGMANAAAGGLMLAATQLLFVQGWDSSPARTIAGAAVGAVVIGLMSKWIHARGEPDIAQLKGASARMAFLIIAVMTAHSAAEGIGVGVSFGGGDQLGLLIALAIGIHNIPEGLAISLAMVPHGSSVRSAAWWSVFSSVPQPLLATPAFIFVEHFRSVLPIGLGFAGGAMLWMIIVELLPEALERTTKTRTFLGVLGGYLVMLAITLGVNPH